MTIFPFKLIDVLQGAFWFLLGAIVSYVLSHRKALYSHIQYKKLKHPDSVRSGRSIKTTEEEVNILIWNGGNTVISGNDVSAKHPILVISSKKFTKTMSIINSSPHIEAFAQPEGSYKLKILFDFLNPGDAFAIRTRIRGDQDIKVSLQCSGAIKGLSKGIKKFKNTPYVDSIFLLCVMVPTLIFMGAAVVKGLPYFWKFCLDFFDGNLVVAGRNMQVDEYILIVLVIVTGVVYALLAFLLLNVIVIMAIQNLAGIPRFVQERALEFDPPPDLPHPGIL